VRLEHVSLPAFRRFVGASFYVNRKLVALVGSNEAGKSSVLQALKRFSNEAAVPQSDLPRTIHPLPASMPIAQLVYRLDAGDKRASLPLPLRSFPATATLTKHSAGEVTWAFQPPAEINPRIASGAVKSLGLLRSAATEVAGQEDVDLIFRDEVVQLQSEVLDAEDVFSGTEPSSSGWRTLFQVRDSVKAARGLNSQEEAAWALVDDFHREHVLLDDISTRLQSALEPRVPEFVEFDRELRTIRDDYDLEALVSGTEGRHPPLDNLLRFAETTIEELHSVALDRPRKKNFLRDLNKSLKSRFKTQWKQSDAFVKLDIEDRRLYVYVEDGSSEFTAKFSERSDGLRMFVALACSLGVTSRVVEPIVLIDEADLHLHIDAQADLISMLERFKGITQVIYTTHSPGCLPSDLGTGVRLVARSKSDPRTSLVHASFWAATDPDEYGVSPFLYLLGARAASFSRLRRAVIAEGETEPFLGPAVLRSAHDKLQYEVPFQFVSGLSSASDAGLEELHDVAVRVAFLVDGDPGGQVLSTRVQRVLGVHEDRVRSLPDGFAIEDFIDPQVYLDAYNKLVLPKSRIPGLADLGSGIPIKKAIKDWAKSHKVQSVGPIAVAEMLLTDMEKSSSGLLPLAIGASQHVLELEAHLVEQLALANG
jgi:hypothetical protein